MIRTIPKYSWTRKFDDKEPESSVHSPGVPPWYEIIKLLPIAYRISSHIAHEKRNKREPIFDLNGVALQPPNPGPHAGAPLGGIGCGCIGRGFKGEFRRWSLHPGKYVHKAIIADVFAVRVNRNGKIESVVLSLMKPDEYSCLTNWNWNMSAKCGTYYAVYPRAWTVYEDPLPGIRVVIKQISPFIPENYADASLPAAVFEVEVENKSLTEEIDVSVMFCFQNGLDSDCSGDRSLKNFHHVAFTTDTMNVSEIPSSIDPVSDSSFSVSGVAMHHETSRIHLTTVREREEVIQSDADVIYSTNANSRASDDNSNNLCSVLISEAERIVETQFTDKISIAIAGKKESSNSITSCSQFITRPQVSASSFFDCRSEAGNGGKGNNMQDYDNESTTAEELWLEFHNTGNIFDRNYAFSNGNSSSDTSFRLSERRYGSAVCIRQTIPRASSASTKPLAGNSRPLNCGVFSFSLAWDYPLARFGGGKALPRYYTRFFGNDGYNAANLAAYALWKAADWEGDIAEWQNGVFESIQSELQQSLQSSSTSLPMPTFFPLPNQSEYYYYQLFNELYYLVDGGTQWLDSAGGRSNQSYPGSMMMIDETREIKEEETSIMVKRQSHERSDQHIVIDKMVAQENEASLQTKLITSEQPRNTPDRIRIASQSVDRKRAFAKFIRWEQIVSIAEDMIKHNEKARYCAGNQSIIGQFLYLEGHEYLMYNTYDVHFYASFALIMLWPQLELSLQKDFAYAVLREDLTRRQMMGEGDYCIRKKKGAVPHDVGAPCEEPWEFCNAYNFQDVSRWKDLGSKFILQIYRNYYYLTQILPSTSRGAASSELTDQNRLQVPAGHRKHEQLLLQYLKELYPVLLTVMQSMEKQFDTDNDGMIENSGFPDQTYDIWIAEGVHAYCGGLWISACEAIGRIASLVDDSAHQEYYHNLAEKGRKVYLKELWNGVYLNYDNSQSSHHDSIMADMLAGQWYARACQLPPPISAGHAFSCLKTIYENNVIAFGKGQLLGAVNGMRPDKEVADQSCLQSREVWTGTTYGVAAAMLQEAFHFPAEGVDEGSLLGAIGSTILSIEQRKELVSMAYTTAKGIHDAGWQKLGYWFATPEAWGPTGNYRSLGYMRPLSIWAMQYARVQSEATFSKLKKSQEEEE